MKTETMVSIVSALLAGWAIYKSNQANKISEDSNRTAEEANQIARAANDIARQGDERQQKMMAHQMGAYLEIVAGVTSRSMKNNQYKYSTSVSVYNKGMSPIHLISVNLSLVAVIKNHQMAYYDKEQPAQAVLGTNPPDNIKSVSFEFSVQESTPVESCQFLVTAKYQDPLTGMVATYTQTR